ncbi:hypothetical protein RND71_012268 [Anisodus tanguticus]|uniref:Uncharacterized protein n=1 Tax=Anisodus tanguticus TaxID=243964 RepID=A0AAE1SEY3_9SOLA|nr:hypothetical protein RND71_012268 [Anisodus tanguticus]
MRIRCPSPSFLMEGTRSRYSLECAQGKPRTDAIACKPRQPINHTWQAMCDRLNQEGLEEFCGDTAGFLIPLSKIVIRISADSEQIVMSVDEVITDIESVSDD